ncbi:MAG: hypothetical protein QXV17_07450 [Candidatus Micrarchaeaceae archaeon]
MEWSVGKSVLFELKDEEEIRSLIKNLELYANKAKMQPKIFFIMTMEQFFDFDYNIFEPDFNVNLLYNENPAVFKVTVVNPTVNDITKFLNASLDEIIEKMEYLVQQITTDDGVRKIYAKFNASSYIFDKYCNVVEYEIQKYNDIEGYSLVASDPKNIIIEINPKNKLAPNTDEIKSIVEKCNNKLSQLFKTDEINIIVTGAVE